MRRIRPLLTAAVLSAVLVGTTGMAGAGEAPAAPAGAGAPGIPNGPWTPGPPVFGVAAEQDLPVTMADGTVLRADVYRPADPAGGAAPGLFPVLLTMTPYGKGNAARNTSGVGSGANPFLVQRGYIEVVADVRGTGNSHGRWDLFDPVQTSDGVALVHWAATLPGSNGSVGLFGASYMGINQLLTAAATGPNSPLKAILPEIAANDIYRDTAFMGGILDAGLGAGYLGAVSAINLLNPLGSGVRTGPADLAGVEADHAGALLGQQVRLITSIATGGPEAYDGAYWAARRPQDVLSAIVANGIPAYLVGGWFDVFQRGSPLNYSGLQNAWAGRPVGAPMAPDQPVTGRYQLLMGPWYHVTAGEGVDLDQIRLQWFDTWLKGAPTGMADTPTPLHVFALGADRWLDARTWPLTPAASRWYLGPASLEPTSPAGRGGADPLVFTGLSAPCGRHFEQWSMGFLAVGLEAMGLSDPCAADDRLTQLPPGAATYTTAPFGEPMVLAGPIGATVYATATTTETEWVVTLEDVAPDGGSTPLTQGALLGSLRAVDGVRSWPAPDGGWLLPYHPYTQASAEAVVPGQVTRYDIEVFPTLARLAPGHRLRVTLATSDVPHLLPTVPALARLAGGVYQVQRSPEAPSSVELPLVPAATLGLK